MTPSELADISVKYWLSQDDLVLQEQLQMLDEVIDGPNRSKAESCKQIANELEKKIKEIVKENSLCPKCYSDKLESKKIEYGYYELPELKVWCGSCDYIDCY